MTKYVNLELEKINQVVQAVTPYMEHMVCIHNIENQWYKPSLFARPVDPEDFKEYKMSAATLMGGFSGEYWKLKPQEDDEKDSYETISRMQGLLGNEGGLSISILGINH
jgi:hypothetical protein